MSGSEDSNKSRLHGLVVKPAAAGSMTLLCGSVPMEARLPDAASAPAPILPGMWVNFEMDLSTGVNQIVCECAPRYKTYLFDDDTFQVLSPATYYITEEMDEEYDRVAYTPYFKFVDDPDGILQDIDWLEWYEVLLTGTGDDSAYLLKVERIVRGMAGCVEPGALPGKMPTRAQIEATIKADAEAQEKNFKAVREVNSCQLGLCIGHVTYDRMSREGSDKMSGYASGGGDSSLSRGGGRGGRGGRGGGYGGNWNNGGGYNDRWGGGGRGGGMRTGYGASSHDWRRGGESSGDTAGRSDGVWREGVMRQKEARGSQQSQRSKDPNKLVVKASVIFSPRGLVISKLEQESYNEGEWLTFAKMCKSDYTVTQEQAGRDTYLPYILQHSQMPEGYGGKSRVKDGRKGEWGVQVLVQAEYGWLRAKQWCEPSFFGTIKCPDMLQRKALMMLRKEKLGWAEMTAAQQDAVLVNVWVGMDLEFTTLKAMDPFPTSCQWEVKDLPTHEFIHDLPLDKARAAGALPAIVL